MYLADFVLVRRVDVCGQGCSCREDGWLPGCYTYLVEPKLVVDFDSGVENIANRLPVCLLVQFSIAMAFMKYLLPVLAAGQVVFADSCEYLIQTRLVSSLGIQANRCSVR